MAKKTAAEEIRDVIGLSTGVGANAGKQLKGIVERVERLQEKKRALQEDIKEIFMEAKSNGFDVKVVRRVVKERAMDQELLDEIETLAQVYKEAITKAK